MRVGTVSVWVGLIGSGIAVAVLAAELHVGGDAGPATPVSSGITVEMTAATLADDCHAPGAPRAMDGMSYKEHTPCGQASMQLSVVAAAGAAPSQLRVKSVELFDEDGTRIGELEAGSAIAWSPAGQYEVWDGSIAPARELSVSYSLSQPDWARVEDRFDKSYQLKVVLRVGGSDQTLERDVTLSAQTSLPPDVVT